MKKINVKLNIAIFIMLFITFVFCSSVSAETMTVEDFEKISEEIRVNISTNEAISTGSSFVGYASAKLRNAIEEEITKQSNKDFPKVYMTFADTENSNMLRDITKVKIYSGNVIYKIVTIVYNDENYNLEDKKCIEDVLKEYDFKLNHAIIDFDSELANSPTYEKYKEFILEEYKKLIMTNNEFEISYFSGNSGFDWPSFDIESYLYFSKNNVTYFTTHLINDNFKAGITIPSSVENTENAVIEYAINKIKGKLPNYAISLVRNAEAGDSRAYTLTLTNGSYRSEKTIYLTKEDNSITASELSQYLLDIFGGENGMTEADKAEWDKYLAEYPITDKEATEIRQYADHARGFFKGGFRLQENHSYDWYCYCQDDAMNMGYVLGCAVEFDCEHGVVNFIKDGKVVMSFAGIKYLGGVASNGVNLKDEKTGIKLETEGNILSADTILSVNELTETQNNIVSNALSSVSSKFVAYNMTLESAAGIKVQPNGNVKISILLPDGYDISKLEIYRIDDDGTKTKYDVKVEGNYATFETNHFSIYVLSEKKTSPEPTNTSISYFEKNNNIFVQFMGKGTNLTFEKLQAQYGNITKVNGKTDLPEASTIIKTGDTFIMDDKEYTVVIYGDVNGDGSINALDALKILKYAAELDELTDTQKLAADVRNDGNNAGKYNVLDALQILRFCVELIDSIIV